MTNDLRHTAIHEAGHAVVGRALGLQHGQASVEQDDESAGHSITADPYDTLEYWWACDKHGRNLRSVIRARVIMLMAGAEAEVAILSACDGGDGDDRWQIGGVIEDEGREQRLRRFAAQLVRRHRTTIEAVADELQRRGTISGEDLDVMVSGPGLVRQPQWWEEPIVPEQGS